MHIFYEFGIKVRLWQSAWHGYQWCVRTRFYILLLCMLCIFVTSDGDEASIKSAKEIITPVAEQQQQQDCDSPVVFFYSLGDDTSDSLRDFVGIAEEDDNILVILDIPSQKLYVAEDEVLSREAVRKFVTDFAAGKLDGKKLRG